MAIGTIIRGLTYYILLIVFTCIYSLVMDLVCMITFIRPITPTTRNKIVNWFKYSYAHAIMLILKVCGVTFYVDRKVASDRMIWISNHRSKLDGLIIQSFLYVNGCYNVAVIKKAICYYPFFGSFSRNMDSVFIDRADETSNEILKQASSKSLLTGDSVLIFAEGTTLSLASKLRSDNFANENGLRKFTNVLIPRKSGVEIIKKNGKFDRIGDLTLRYDNPPLPGFDEHSYLDLLKIFPHDIFINVKYFDSDNLDLYQVYENKNDFLAQEHSKSDYLKNNYSFGWIIFNATILISFCYLFYSQLFFRYGVYLLSIYTIGRVFVTEKNY